MDISFLCKTNIAYEVSSVVFDACFSASFWFLYFFSNLTFILNKQNLMFSSAELLLLSPVFKFYNLYQLNNAHS